MARGPKPATPNRLDNSAAESSSTTHARSTARPTERGFPPSAKEDGFRPSGEALKKTVVYRVKCRRDALESSRRTEPLGGGEVEGGERKSSLYDRSTVGHTTTRISTAPSRCPHALQQHRGAPAAAAGLPPVEESQWNVSRAKGEEMCWPQIRTIIQCEYGISNINIRFIVDCCSICRRLLVSHCVSVIYRQWQSI